MEDIHLQPGIIGKITESLLDGYTTHLIIANRTHLPHVITIQLENTSHVVLLSQLHLAKKPVSPDIKEEIMLMINGLPHQSIQFLQELIKFKLK